MSNAMFNIPNHRQIVAGVHNLLKSIKDDYAKFNSNEKMREEFNRGLDYTVGKKYIKIITNSGSVWGFVVVEPDEKFFEGDILMAAGWSKPARNQARGNIFSGYDIEWTGPKYLR